MLLFLGLFLMLAGLIMVISPKAIWSIVEKWKSEGATEPSVVYTWSIRFGGIVCIVIANLCFYALSL